MSARGLIDTSAILALLDRGDPRHGKCLEALKSVDLPLGTTEAVLAELFYFVGENQQIRKYAWGFVRSSLTEITSMNADDLPHLEALMEKYADRPMDYADATLVRAGERLGLTTILTLDRADFQTYRMAGKRKFTVLP